MTVSPRVALWALLGGVWAALTAMAPTARAEETDPDPPRASQSETHSDPAAPAGGPNNSAPSEPATTSAAGDILDLDIDQLGKVQAKVPTAFDAEVTSVTSNKSSVGKSPAAVFVITNDMIRRSGATSIPETFRMVPGMQVAKIGSNKWAISSRGFNGQFANKLLVLVDGRSVYTPLSAGVYWESQDLMLQDVERIEVIRGPGATVWGANAVNGVINIITKKAGDTAGALVNSGGGNQDQNINGVRFGGKIGDNANYRIYAKNTERASGFNPTNPTNPASPNGANDDWRTVRGGFRLDWDDPEQVDQLSLQGDIFSMAFGEQGIFPQAAPPFSFLGVQEGHMGGGDLVGRWNRTIDENNSFYVQAYYDRNERLDTLFKFAIDTYDVEMRNTLKHSESHVFTWGAGYRMIHDNIASSGMNGPLNQGAVPNELTYDQANAFVQEEMPLFRDDLKFVIGSKFVYWYFTGFEYQPTARLLWDIDETQAAWGAVSRAVRTPSRGEENLSLLATAAPLPLNSALTGGGRSLVSEEMLAYELGYRQQVNERLSFELATFYNVYRNLIDFSTVGFLPAVPPVVVSQLQNLQNATGYGAELNGQWELTEKWKLRAWYSYLHLQLNGPPGTLNLAGSAPRNQAYLMSSWDLPKNVEFDLMNRYVDNLSAVSVPAYGNLDARLGWRPNNNWEFSVIGQNLLAPHHMEFVGLTTVPSAVNRGVFAQVVWRH